MAADTADFLTLGISPNIDDRRIGNSDWGSGSYLLAKRLSTPTSLRELGFAEADLNRVVDIAA